MAEKRVNPLQNSGSDPPAKMAKMASKKIKIRVGESVSETTDDELQEQDEDSHFHSRLSGRWNNPDGGEGVVKVEERSGTLFCRVLYYLECGDIPR